MPVPLTASKVQAYDAAMIYRMGNGVQPYAWGSRTSFVDLFGMANPDDAPMAELWMGAHPKAPSTLEIGGRHVSLVDHIASDPVRALGPKTAAAFANRLPFLFKVLAASQPLSIQAHPALDQAQAGFADEERRGIPRDAGHRNYRDDNHKPELICAITEFWGMRGFRTAREIFSDFREPELVLALEEVAHLPDQDAIAVPQNDADLGRFFQSLIEADGETRARLVEAAMKTARRRWGSAAAAELPSVDEPDARFYWLLRLAAHCPGDIGVTAPLYLNIFALRPGEATYQPAGVLHAYMDGTGMEIMANSDNVLRGGLTPKHIDVAELLSVGVFRPEPKVVLAGEPTADGCELVYPAPFAEFRLSRIDASGVARRVPANRSAQILFCERGIVDVQAGDPDDPRTITLAAGESAFLDATDRVVTISGNGSVFRATTGEVTA